MRLAFLKRSYQRDQNAILEFYDRDWCPDIGIVYNKFYVQKNLGGFGGFLCSVKYNFFWTWILGPCKIRILIEWLFENLETHWSWKNYLIVPVPLFYSSFRNCVSQKKLPLLPGLLQRFPLFIIITLSTFLATLDTF